MINLAKYVRAKVGDRVEFMKGLDPASQDNGNQVSDAFKVWSYDNSNTLIADGFIISVKLILMIEDKFKEKLQV